MHLLPVGAKETEKTGQILFFNGTIFALIHFHEMERQ